MRRISTFIFGMVVGGLLIYVALNFHLIQARDGLHLVPKVDAELAGTYVDIRQFGPGDIARYPKVALAIFRSGRSDLMESAAGDTLQNGLDELLAPQTR